MYPDPTSKGCIINMASMLQAPVLKIVTCLWQDLSKLKPSELTPLSPEVISRQATINIGALPSSSLIFIAPHHRSAGMQEHPTIVWSTH